MLSVACVNWQNYAGRGIDYVVALRDGVRRWLTGVEHRFVCLTDRPGDLPWGMCGIRLPPGLHGWWNKIALFRPAPEMASGRVLYFDLDTVIARDISPLGKYAGPFAALADPADGKHIGSGVMAWEAGTCVDIWQRWNEAGSPMFHPRGDQSWIEAMRPAARRLQDEFPGMFASYKLDCRDGKPEAASVVYFHGKPRPHEVQDNWVKASWSVAARDDCNTQET